MDNRPIFIPTLDISNGKAVLVKNGKVYKILGDPFEKAQFLSINNHFQVVDIDAAMNIGSNKEIIQKISKKYPCYVGGGIRTYQDAVDYLNSSARRVIISTALSHELVNKIRKERLIIAFDIDEKYNVFKDGRKGFMDKRLFDLIDEYKDNTEIITITFHHTEGTCTGIPMDQVKEIKDYILKYNIRLVVAGGISSIKEIGDLIDLQVIPQFGSGFWNGKFTLGDIFQCISAKVLNIKNVTFKERKLIPTSIQSTDGQLLGEVFSTPESLKLSVDTRIATFHSRETDSCWIKGATSGNYHTVINIHYSCDGTALRFVVEGNTFCHTGSESCFGDTDPARASLKSMQRLLKKRMNSSEEKSYTKALLSDGFKINSKIMEEAEELICATDNDEIISEASDLIYFMLLYLQKNNVEISDVENELIKRRYLVLKDEYDIKIKNQDKLKIGVIVANMPKDFVFDYIEDLFETKIIKKTESPRCLEYLCDNPKIMIIQTKPKDVSTLINNGFLDAVVSYEDIILNYSVNAEKVALSKNKIKHVSIVVACKKDITLDILKEENKTRKLVIMAEYVKLTSEWVKRCNLKAKVVHVSGSSESYLINDMCDMCVVVSDTGETLKANNLIVLDTLVTTSINLFVHPKKKEMLYKLL
ncbi:MAG: bifunctional phosphoribosyl-AMP cyclohydrolase/phosphoribosyl-ATP pyrophosphatase protein [Edafosvirus sp.]|uniref:Bifunctional phosphoribosyl-AMP cyclohydrolase/phosphoribosyl-ATP pyrophosphatase protein n=1 Tax=Edafosvirus sp. TaxID=2487765 RepID=A0A3G4ZV27_9VIRU|nr:MAG: bifunctional phosphoribosyl-AMP cyclohydrolase/phosphoribosyl-ATP pyrophosphatase protein [Edafosvirus sp.]